MRKKTIAVLLALLMTISLLSACGSAAESGKAPAAGSSGGSSEPIRIVTTIFPIYDWVRQITDGTDADLTMLLDNGVDLHSFQPTAADMVTIVNSDLFIYVGGESDEWVEDALGEAENTDLRVIDLLEVLGDAVKEEEIVEGMEAEHDHDHEEAEEDRDHEEEIEYDEHVWLSLRYAQDLCKAIARTLGELDPKNAGLYQANCDAYNEKLAALDAAYAQAAADAAVTTLLFGDRFPFRYLVDDYGLEYYAAFAGCSAETEASFETIVFLAGKVDELGLNTIMQIESADGSIAQTVRDTTRTRDQEILTLNSLQSATGKDVSDGLTYLSVMQENLEILKTALAN